jgi:hypothetical protein
VRAVCRDLHLPFSGVVVEDHFLYIYIDLILLINCFAVGLEWMRKAHWLLYEIGTRLINFI